MSEYQIEIRVERAMDLLDLKLLSGSLSQQQYDAEVRNLAQWANNQYEVLA